MGIMIFLNCLNTMVIPARRTGYVTSCWICTGPPGSWEMGLVQRSYIHPQMEK